MLRGASSLSLFRCLWLMECNSSYALLCLFLIVQWIPFFFIRPVYRLVISFSSYINSQHAFLSTHWLAWWRVHSHRSLELQVDLQNLHRFMESSNVATVDAGLTELKQGKDTINLFNFLSNHSLSYTSGHQLAHTEREREREKVTESDCLQGPADRRGQFCSLVLCNTTSHSTGCE